MSSAAEPFVVVLDDDPTGSQCAAGVDVLLRPAETGLPEALRGAAHSVYALTNTRALDAKAATALVEQIRDECTAHAADRPVRFVLRGDSTLRGHIVAEMDALGLPRGAGLIVPAFPAADRVTIGGVHYLTTGATPVNVADTEFARDPVFGFRARSMRDWITEVGGARPVTLVDGAALDAGGTQAVADALWRVPDGGVVIPDVRKDADLRTIAGGLAAAEAGGRHVVVRCAAPLAARIARVPGRTVAPPATPPARLLVVCGSHTGAATTQLRAIAGRTPPHLTVETDALRGDGAGEAIARTVAVARMQLERSGIAVVASERERRADHGSLADGAAVMAGLMAVVRDLAPDVDAIVSKGGITSAEVATTGLAAVTATVVGQIETGISRWDVASGWGVRVPVAIVPGNIGDAGTLGRMLDYFGRPAGLSR